MREFFVSLFYAAVAGGIASALAGKAFEKHVRYLSALVCAAVLCVPLLSLAPGIRAALPEENAQSGSADTSAVQALLEKQAVEDLEAQISQLIFEQTGIKPQSVGIQIESVDGTLHVRSVSVSAGGGDDAERIRECLSGVFAGHIPVEVLE